MNKIKSIFIIIIVILTSSVLSQVKGDYIDVLHLKDGATIKGIITEQIPSVSVTILTIDGNKTTYSYSQIEKFSSVLADQQFIKKSKQLKREFAWINTFKRKEKGYFIDADVIIGTVSGELRITNGYKFGRMAKFGFGTGFGLLPLNSKNQVLPHFLLNIMYSGDILNKRITPFYEIELGYGIPLGNKYTTDFHDSSRNELLLESEYPLIGLEYKNYGGPKGGLVFGLKMKTKKKIQYKVSLDYRITTNFSDATSVEQPYNGEMSYTKQTIKGIFSLIGGFGLRFGLGF